MLILTSVISLFSFNLNAYEIQCSTLQIISNFDPIKYSNYRNNPLTESWSKSLINDVESRFLECINLHSKKSGPTSRRVKSLSEAKAAFELNKNEISKYINTHITKKNLAEDIKKLKYTLDDELASFNVTYTPSKKVSDEAFKNVENTKLLVSPLTKTKVEEIKALIKNIAVKSQVLIDTSQKDNTPLNIVIRGNHSPRKLVQGPLQFENYLQYTVTKPYSTYINADMDKLERDFASIIEDHKENPSQDLNMADGYFWKSYYPTEEQAYEILARMELNLNKVRSKAFEVKKLTSIEEVVFQAKLIIKNYNLLFQRLEKEAVKIATQRESLKLNSETYIVESLNSKIGQKLTSLGYSDHMMAFDNIANPHKSAYATLNCISSLYSANKVTLDGKTLTISFGNKEFLVFKPVYSIILILKTHGIEQYVIQDLLNYDLKERTALGKYFDLFKIINQCKEELDIDLAIG